ncbi:MAG: tetratricopeptide repeat protein [Actinomycetales bacterium]|nr:tetratricopeptide repeat protein [Candidatus Phosphoribacter baldrii]
MARDLAHRLATPEALRDLSVSLDNVGAVARARGDWDRAATVYDESLHLRRDLAARLATPEALRDLSVSLNNVGAVARARGDWDRGKASRDAALAIAEGVAVRDNSHETIRLLDWLRRESSTPPSERTNRDPDSEP